MNHPLLQSGISLKGVKIWGSLTYKVTEAKRLTVSRSHRGVFLPFKKKTSDYSAGKRIFPWATFVNAVSGGNEFTEHIVWRNSFFGSEGKANISQVVLWTIEKIPGKAYLPPSTWGVSLPGKYPLEKRTSGG